MLYRAAEHGLSHVGIWPVINWQQYPGTYGIVDSLLIFARDPNKRFLMGSGKAREVMAHAAQLDCDCIVFDNELLPLQQRAWEEESGILVIDRQEVILDIFNMRARTKEARLQVQR